MVINIKATIQGVECNTETDNAVMPFMQGTLYKKDYQYYLYCESVLLNNHVYMGKFGEYEGDLPTEKDVTEDMIDNFDEHTRKMIPLLGDEPRIPRKITKSITLLPLACLPDLFIDEIKKSKIEIGNSIIIKDENELWKFEGSTYSLNVHDNSFYLKSSELIKLSDDEFWIKVNPGDDVIKTHTDNRGYPASCGTGNKNKDVIMIVKWTPVQKPQIGKLRDLSKGE